MAKPTTVYAGAVAPESIKINVPTGDSEVDLTTATGAVLLVNLPDGTDTTWTAVILSGATPSLLTVQHVFVAGDVDATGRYSVVVKLTVPGGIVRSVPKTFTVLSQFATCCPTGG